MTHVIDGYLEDRHGIVIDHARLVDACKPLRQFFGHMSPRQVNAPHTRAYAGMRNRKPGTVLKELRTLRAVLRWGEHNDWIDKAPHIEMPASPLPRERWLSRDEFQRLLDGCGSQHIRLWCLLAVYTAARKSAILSLKWSQIDFESGLVDYNEPGRPVTAKKRAVVPMGKIVRQALEDARELAKSDFVIEWNRKPVKAIKRGFNEACRRAGLVGVTPHDLRRTAGTWAAQGGVPMAQIARMLGHDDEATTSRVYAKWSPEYLRNVVEALEG